MEKLFGIKKAGSTVRTEVMAGLTTFFTMAYIMFVNPNILSLTGMSWSGVFVATIIATAIGTLIMGLVAKVPYAVAPGMGLNAFFTFTVVFALGFTWREALAMVFICGLINMVITVTKFRKAIIKAIPHSLQMAIGGGIGLFIAYIGIKNAGFLKFTSDPGANVVLDDGTVIADSSIVPALANFADKAAVLALIGLLITIILMVLKVKGAILIGIVATTLIGIPMGVTILPDKLVDVSQIGEIKEVSFAFFGSDGLASLFSDPSRIFMVIITIFAFALADTFDTIGTFIGTGRKTGIFDEEDETALTTRGGFKSKMEKALFSDMVATTAGALAGTSNATTYVESASGISVGGRTGLTSVVVAVLFLLCLPFASLFGIVPAAATAPALIVVGILMAEAFIGVKWTDFEEAVPAFFTIAIMAMAYNISYGIAAGFFFYIIVKAFRGKFREIHPIIIGASILFLINFIVMAIKDL